MSELKSALSVMILVGIATVVKETPMQLVEGLLLVILYMLFIPMFENLKKK